MTDERDKLTSRSDSARATARDVPLARPLGSGGESAPQAMRGQRLEPGRGAPERVRPEDVELAVLREVENLETRDGRALERAGYGSVEARAKRLPLGGSSALPVAAETTPRSPEAREAKSGTLLSVGSIDPRGPTERSLETPRMFMTQAEAEAEVYFTPKPPPRATDHPTLETETVRIAESADPRRAVTQPRLRWSEQPAPAPAEPGAGSLGTSGDLSEPSLGPDEISTTPEPLAHKKDEQRRVRPADTLDPKKVSTQPELPRLKRSSDAPTMRLSRSVPPAEIAAEGEPAQKTPVIWLWAVAAAAVVALLLVWLVRTRSMAPSAASAEAVPTAPAAPPATVSKADRRPKVVESAPHVDDEIRAAPAPSLEPVQAAVAAEKKPAARERKPADKPSAPSSRQAIY